MGTNDVQSVRKLQGFDGAELFRNLHGKRYTSKGKQRNCQDWFNFVFHFIL
jgi:hypothetical protein